MPLWFCIRPLQVRVKARLHVFVACRSYDGGVVRAGRSSARVSLFGSVLSSSLRKAPLFLHKTHFSVVAHFTARTRKNGRLITTNRIFSPSQSLWFSNVQVEYLGEGAVCVFLKKTRHFFFLSREALANLLRAEFTTCL